MGKRLERFGEVRIIDETNGFGLVFVEKTVNCQKTVSMVCTNKAQTLVCLAPVNRTEVCIQTAVRTLEAGQCQA